MINPFIEKLSNYSFTTLVSIATVVVLSGSIPTVYLFAMLFSVEYTSFLLIISICLPMILTPPVVLFLLTASKNLKHIKEMLHEEVEKNKENDIRLFEQARFVLMGEMMANISHQWKQPLNTMGLSIVSLRTSELCSSGSEKYFDILEDNINYLATTVDDFISFFDKKSSSELRAIESLVKEINSIIDGHMRSANIDLEILIDDTQGKVKIASSISQVILNLINNAKDAFSSQSTQRKIRVLFYTTQHGLEIECCDNGTGIADEIKEKIFSPYFTTKHKSQGTGIGLYMSKEIIQKIFHGDINMNTRKSTRSQLYPQSNDNKTCFFIAIPYSQQCVLNEEGKI